MYKVVVLNLARYNIKVNDSRSLRIRSETNLVDQWYKLFYALITLPKIALTVPTLTSSGECMLVPDMSGAITYQIHIV